MSVDQAAFLDTNVLLYLLSDDTKKAETAESVLETGGVISVQVLNEFVNVCQRKLRMDWPDTRATLSVIRAVCTVEPFTESVHDLGTKICEGYKLSVYDSMIVAVALEAGCTRLLSEDMHTGMQIEGRLKIENPFKANLI